MKKHDWLSMGSYLGLRIQDSYLSTLFQTLHGHVHVIHFNANVVNSAVRALVQEFLQNVKVK